MLKQVQHDRGVGVQYDSEVFVMTGGVVRHGRGRHPEFISGSYQLGTETLSWLVAARIGAFS